MSTDKFDKHDLSLVVDSNDQSVLIACGIEYHSIVLENAGTPELLLDVLRSLPAGFYGLRMPGFKWSF